MNKKEQAEMEQLRHELAIAKALRFTSKVEPDVQPPSGSGLVSGWTFNEYNDRIDEGCTSSMAHAIGRTDKTTSQRPLRLYSSRLLALRALRARVEKIVAERLATIDRLIDAEVSDG